MKDADADADKIEIMQTRETQEELAALGIYMDGVKCGTPEEAERAAMYVCVPVIQGTDFPDCLIAACSQCNVPIFYRPHAPKKPPKVCCDCAGIAMTKPWGRA